ncbi:MAG: hypothetical protein J2P57_18935, partial [Acidimicrobiaceae bacterium]|nr:hypothetical protein [Acidimicrobiaceae bacterium]
MTTAQGGSAEAPTTSRRPGGSEPGVLARRDDGAWRLALPVVVLATVAVAVFLSLSPGGRHPGTHRPTALPSPAAGRGASFPVISTSPTTPTEGQATRAFVAEHPAALRPLSADMVSINRDSEGALEGDFGQIGADARRLAGDVRDARAAPPPADRALAARWTATLT